MKPIGKYIIVSDIDEEIKTGSGILLSGKDADQLRYKKAEVVAVGTDVGVIQAKDVIFYDKRQSFTMMINDMTVTVLREADVVVVV